MRRRVVLVAGVVLLTLCLQRPVGEIGAGTANAQSNYAPGASAVRVLDDFSFTQRGSWWDPGGGPVYVHSVKVLAEQGHFAAMHVAYDKGMKSEGLGWHFFAFKPEPVTAISNHLPFTDIFCWMRAENPMEILVKVEESRKDEVSDRELPFAQQTFTLKAHSWTPIYIPIGRNVDANALGQIYFFAEPGRTGRKGGFMIDDLALVSRDALAYGSVAPSSTPRIVSVVRSGPASVELTLDVPGSESWQGLLEVQSWNLLEPASLRGSWTTQADVPTVLAYLAPGQYGVRVRRWTHFPEVWGFPGVAGPWSAAREFEVLPPATCDGGFEETVAYYRAALGTRYSAHNPLVEGDLALALGSCYLSRGLHEEAETCQTRSIAAFRRGEGADAQRGEANGLLGLGHNYYCQGLAARAIPVQEQALGLYRRIEDLQGEANALLALANSHLVLGDNLEDTYRYCTDALQLYEGKLRDTTGTANALLALGHYWRMRGDFRQARSLFERAKGLYIDGSDRANALLALGNCAYFLGEYRSALDYYHEAADLKRTAQDPAGEGNSRLGLGSCHEALGDYETAIADFESALFLFESGRGMQAGVANSKLGIGTCQAALGQIQEATDAYAQALRLFTAVAAIPGGEASAYLGLGDCSFAGQKFGEAAAHYAAARDIFEVLGDELGEARSCLEIGRCHAAMGRHQEARSQFEAALDLTAGMTAVGHAAAPEVAWRAQFCLGTSWVFEQDLQRAVAIWKQAVDVIEDMRGAIGAARFVSSFMEDKRVVCEVLVPALLELGLVEDALSYAERAKARILVDMMETAMASQSPVLPAQLEGGSATYRELSALVHAETAYLPGAAAAQAGGTDLLGARPGSESAGQKAKSGYDSFLAGLEETNPALSSMLAVSSARIQSYLYEVIDKLVNCAALEYFVTEKETILWVVSKQGVQTARRLPVSRAELASKVGRFVEAIQEPSAARAKQQLREMARELYDLLVSPVEEYLVGASHLVIVPSDVLFYVSFAALRKRGDTPQSADRYLVEDYSLSYAPSLTSLYWPYQHEAGETLSSVLSVGNPTLDRPGTEMQAKEVAKLFTEPTLLLREEATETTVREELAKGYDVAHLATHGVFDRELPLCSEVFLYPARPGVVATPDTNSTDGNLYAGEILGLKISGTELVVLSACETALPAEMSHGLVAGDEIQGLGQSLFVTGVPSALMTLWEVADASTARLMVGFYQNLKSGQAAGTALAEIQRELLADEYPDPWFWAPFVLYGLWNPGGAAGSSADLQ